MARPPSKLYRFQKLVRRNKLAFAAGAAGRAGPGAWRHSPGSSVQERNAAEANGLEAEEARQTCQAAEAG